jgi:pyruvate kinase
MRQTKIVATLSDIKGDQNFIKMLYEGGMNVARLNTAHLGSDGAKMLITNIRAVSDKIAILIDTKGPEIRTCSMQNEIFAYEGQEIRFSYALNQEQDIDVCVNHSEFVSDLKIGDRILIDDGEIALQVTQKHADYLVGRVENSGIIKNNKSVNVPGVITNLPALSEKDKWFIQFAAENDVDFIAHSFVRNKEDILEVQNLLDQHNSKIKIISKIENLEGVENIDEILEHSYGIMIARGDLGIEIPPEKIPIVQRNLIYKSIMHKKPVIVATQMLHSMIQHPRPTRAEVNDVASAVYSRADAVMLSGETAIGKYPFEAVRTMARIAREVELDQNKQTEQIQPPVKNEIPAYLAQSAIRSAIDLNPKAIVTSTTTGKTARYLAAYRSEIPVYAVCHYSRVVRELALSFGVIPSFGEIKKNRLEIQKAAIHSLLKNNTFQLNDLVIYVGGRFGENSEASYMEISTAIKLYKSTIQKKEDPDVTGSL